MNKKWEYIVANNILIEQIVEKFQISELLATIIINRGVTSEKEISTFLNPTRDNFHDPFLLPDIQKAITRIKKAIEQQEKVIIYGDYDVDGITSLTVLKKFLEGIGLVVDYHIPNRLNEGYGLNKEAIQEFSQKGYTLMITVDCGISGQEEVVYANTLHLDTIITDHHEPLEVLPDAIAVINPKRSDSEYPFRDLAGVGVVFKLIQALGMDLELEPKEYLKYLDLVCVGTISDIVPLVDENRVIAKLGLKLVEQTKNIGLKSLISSSGFKEINSNTISFGIAPRINACGRMGFEEEALKLFLTNNIMEAQNITEELNQYNKQRQETEKNILKEALEKIEQEALMEKDCIVLAGENWHHGVIGIVASKITEMYFKPTILMCIEGEIAKGSGRSVPGFDLHKALCSTSEWLEKYGGHEMAVGLSMKTANFEKFKAALKNIVQQSDLDNIIPIIYIDKQITLKEIDKKVVQELKYLEPYGEANKMPIFSIKNLKIDSIRALSDGKHLKLTLKEESRLIDAIGFQMGDLVQEYQLGDRIDVAGTLEINSFNGNDTLQINLKSVMKSY